MDAQANHKKLVDPLADMTTSLEALLQGAFGELSTQQRDTIKHVYGAALELQNLLADIIQSLGLENIAKRFYLQQRFHRLLNPIVREPHTLLQTANGSLSEEQRVCIEYVVETGRLLSRHIENLWLYSRLQHGKFSLTLTEFDLEQVLKPLELPITTEPISLELLLPEDLPYVRGDAQATYTVVQQLLRNAIRFTQQGSIRISVLTVNDIVKIRVEDTGCGMAPEHVPLITQPFFQVAPSSGGIGLGLSIAQRLMHLQEGDIHIQSEVGRGTTVTLTLPTAQSQGW